MFDFESEELRVIRESTRKLARSELPKYQKGSHFEQVPRELLLAFAKLGLTGLSVSEDYNGLASDALTIAAVIEELAAVDLGAAIFLSVHLMVSGLIERHGSTDLKQRFLPKLSSGHFLGAFALTEPSAGSDAARLRTNYTESKAEYILNGEKCYITSAGSADLYLVFAREPNSTGANTISAFVVEAGSKGLLCGKAEQKMGAELSPIASLTFTDLHIPKVNLLGQLGHGYKVALSGLAGGRVNVAASANGISRTALQLALAHLKTREQFGQKLSEFQALQFILADMFTKLEASRLLTWQAAETLAKDPTGTLGRLNPALAKCFATDSAMAITTDAVQLLGGAGYIRDYHVERLMRDAKMLQIVEGTNQIQRIVIARELIESAGLI